MAFILWIIAVALVIYGIVTIVRGNLVLGIVLIVLGLLVGPGGVSIFTGDDDDDDGVDGRGLTEQVCNESDGPQFACWLAGMR